MRSNFQPLKSILLLWGGAIYILFIKFTTLKKCHPPIYYSRGDPFCRVVNLSEKDKNWQNFNPQKVSPLLYIIAGVTLFQGCKFARRIKIGKISTLKIKNVHKLKIKNFKNWHA
jgi:hypothetical protein